MGRCEATSRELELEAAMYLPGRTLFGTRRDLRMGFYGGNDGRGKQLETVDVGGCWRIAEDEMSAWIKKGRDHAECL